MRHLRISSPPEAPGVHILTMCKPPENRLTVEFATDIIAALRYIETELIGHDRPGAVVLSSFSEKFWCTGLDLQESEANMYANSDGFHPLLATLLDYPHPTVALITGHTFGGACPLALSFDYRVMNKRRGFFCMPPVNLGLQFDGIGLLPRLKTNPQIARKMLLEGHRWTGETALADGIVDQVAEPADMEREAVKLASTHADRSTMGVYGLLRAELWGEALNQMKVISYVHRKRIGTSPKAKI